MKTIAFLSKKGGCGKTTTICSLAFYWAEKEWKTVAISDLEEDGTSESFVQVVDHPKISAFEKGGNYDFHLIDTPGGTSDADLKQILKASDMVIVPLIPGGGGDLKKTALTLSVLGKSNKVHVLFSAVDLQTLAGRERDENLVALEAKGLANFLCDRAAYRYLANADKRRGFTKETTLELSNLAREIAP